MVRLMQEKENAENTVSNLQQEIQVMSRMFEEYREQMEAKTSQMEEHLTLRAKEAEFLLMQSKKRVEEVEAASELKSQLWSKKTNTFRSYMDNQKLCIKVSVVYLCVIKFLYILLCIFFYYSTLVGHKDIVSVY
jgi:kinesin family protein C2/C3